MPTQDRRETALANAIVDLIRERKETTQTVFYALVICIVDVAAGSTENGNREIMLDTLEGTNWRGAIGARMKQREEHRA